MVDLVAYEQVETWRMFGEKNFVVAVIEVQAILRQCTY